MDLFDYMREQNMEKEAEALRDRAEKDAKHEIERARMEAAELVQKTRREAQSLLDELEDLRRNKQKLLTAEQKAQVESILQGAEQTRTYLGKIRAEVQTPLRYKRNAEQ